MESLFEEIIMKAKFSHIMNDDLTGITFLYFNKGTVQDLAHGKDTTYADEFCIHLDEDDHKKLEAALRNEPCNADNQRAAE